MRGVGEYRGRRQSSPDLKSLAPPARPQAITFSASQDHYSPSGKCLYFLPAFRKVPRGTGAAYRIRSAAERWRNISLTFSSKTAINRHRGRPLDRSPATPPGMRVRTGRFMKPCQRVNAGSRGSRAQALQRSPASPPSSVSYWTWPMAPSVMPRRV